MLNQYKNYKYVQALKENMNVMRKEIEAIKEPM